MTILCTYFPALTRSTARPSCVAPRSTKKLAVAEGDDPDLAAYFPARRHVRVYIRIGSTGTDGGDDRGKVTSRELLGWLRPGYHVCGSDRSFHCALLRACRGKAGRIRICCRLAQKDDDTAG